MLFIVSGCAFASSVAGDCKHQLRDGIPFVSASNNLTFYGILLQGESDPWTLALDDVEGELRQGDTASTASLAFSKGANVFFDGKPSNELLNFSGRIGTFSSSTNMATVAFAAAKLPVDVAVADPQKHPGVAMSTQLGSITHIQDPVVEALQSRMGITFVTSTKTPDVEFILTLKTEETEQLSSRDPSGGVYLYQARFRSGIGRSPIALPFADFKLTLHGREVSDAPPLSYSGDFRLTEIGFLLSRESLEGARDTKVPFDFDLSLLRPAFRVEPLIGPLEMSLLAGSGFEAVRTIEPKDRGFFLAAGSLALKTNLRFNRDSVEAKEMETLNSVIVQEYRSAVRRLHSDENVKYALEIGRQGPEAIRNELNRLGLIEDKITTFDSMTEKRDTPSWFYFLLIRGFPVERDHFSESHGAFSHHLQMIAMSRELSAPQLSNFKFMVREMFKNSAYWLDLNFLVDNYDVRLPSSPEFWNTRLSLLRAQAH